MDAWSLQLRINDRAPIRLGGVSSNAVKFCACARVYSSEARGWLHVHVSTAAGDRRLAERVKVRPRIIEHTCTLLSMVRPTNLCRPTCIYSMIATPIHSEPVATLYSGIVNALSSINDCSCITGP